VCRGILILAILVLAFVARTTGQQVPQPLVTVGHNVQISASKPSTMHSEGTIVADPTDAKHLLVCAMFRDERIVLGVAAYVSDDGGDHWERTFESQPDQPAGDPTCAFGPDGTAYLTMMPMKRPSLTTMRLPLLRSVDHGRTWQAGGVTGGLDRDGLVVDETRGPFRSHVYVHGVGDTYGTTGASRDTVELYASADGGRTFGRPAQRVSMTHGYIYGMGNSVVLSNGRWLTVAGEVRSYYAQPDNNAHVVDAFGAPPEPENARLIAVTSDDGGDSLNEPVTIGAWHMPRPLWHESAVTPFVAVDSSDGPFRDRLYVVWPDSRFGGTAILLSYSSDRGRTWAPAVVINDDRRPLPPAPIPDHLLPSVAVNNAGVAAVAWLDRRDQPDNLGWHLRMRVSLDGGDTFLPSTIASEGAARFDGREHWPALSSTSGGGTPAAAGGLLRVLLFAAPHLYTAGDFAGLAADRDGGFHPYWIDNRTGWNQAWTAQVNVAGKAMKNGAADLAALDDITALTTLERLTSSYDAVTQTATVTERLSNTSQQTLDGPFKIRLLTLDSEVAIVDVVGASNGATGVGAVWDVTPHVNGARLGPGETSRPITLTFKLRDMRPMRPDFAGRLNNLLVRFFARILGQISK
jgi:hypothetical protein